MSPSSIALSIMPKKTTNCTNVMKLMKTGENSGNESSSARTIDSCDTCRERETQREREVGERGGGQIAELYKRQ
jgi:hypothetical protein